MIRLFIMLCFYIMSNAKLETKSQHSLNQNEKFNFLENNPLDFIDYLKKNSSVNIFMISPDSIPENWLNSSIIDSLFLKINSDTPTLPVYPTYAGINVFVEVLRSTEGYESLAMLYCLMTKKKYPYFASGSINIREEEVNKIISWYTDYKLRKE